ncbi:MAG: rRNA maturation RNase YbeY [Clostridia bacterium]|nr:rRNA maturation RNase YbeY [Clostridia bacterium]
MALIISNQQEIIPLHPQWEDKLTAIADKCLILEEVDPDAEISLVFTDDEGIRELNKTYRGKDEPTDVLSFALLETGEGEMAIVDGEEELLLGDIIISLETASRQAEEYGHSLDREIAYLMVHGLLHLLGYDHMTEEDKKIMRQREEELLAAVGLTRE